MLSLIAPLVFVLTFARVIIGEIAKEESVYLACACFAGTRRRQTSRRHQRHPVSAADLVRPKLLLEVKAANKVGCAIKGHSPEGC